MPWGGPKTTQTVEAPKDDDARGSGAPPHPPTPRMDDHSDRPKHHVNPANDDGTGAGARRPWERVSASS